MTVELVRLTSCSCNDKLAIAKMTEPGRLGAMFAAGLVAARVASGTPGKRLCNRGCRKIFLG